MVYAGSTAGAESALDLGWTRGSESACVVICEPYGTANCRWDPTNNNMHTNWLIGKLGGDQLICIPLPYVWYRCERCSSVSQTHLRRRRHRSVERPSRAEPSRAGHPPATMDGDRERRLGDDGREARALIYVWLGPPNPYLETETNPSLIY